jgi:hypothetical protein
VPSSLLSRCSPRYLTSSSSGGCALFIWNEVYVSLRVVNVTWIDLNPLDFILHFDASFELHVGWFAISVEQ